VILLDEARERASQDRLIEAILQGSPKVKTVGNEIRIASVEEAIRAFDDRLTRPLDDEKQRARVLRLVDSL
jgi:hypothetical protein